MASIATPSLQIEVPGSGDYRGTWAEVMQRILTQIDKAIAGATTITTTGGTVELTDTEYVDNQTRQSTIWVKGALTSNVVLVVPARGKRYIVINDTTGSGKTVSIKTASGDAVACPAQGSVGEVRVNSDGTIYRVGPYVDKATGAVTSTSYALQSSLTSEVDRATAEELTLAKLDGSRDFTGAVGGVTPTADAHLATKQYVDVATGLQDNIYTTTGSASAYVVTTGASLTLFDKMTLTIRPHATNAANVTLKVDGNAVKPIRGFTGKSLPAGVAILGTPYRVMYDATSGEFLFIGFFDNPYNVPIGAFMPFSSTAVPNSSFALPFGQALSRTIYASYFNLVGTTFGAGNGSSTFNIPDLRGRGIIGLDNMGGTSANRITLINGGVVGETGGAESILIARADLPNVTLGGSTNTTGAHTHSYKDHYIAGSGGGYEAANNYAMQDASRTTGSAGSHSHTITTDSINGGVTQTRLENLQPSIILPMLLRVI